MNPGRFFLPGMRTNFSPVMGMRYLPTRNGFGFFGKITNSLKTFNWGGLLNGANKTLNVVNQTIPLVRQAGPMLNNMKSMLRLARAFGGETSNSIAKNNPRNNNKISNNINNNNVNLATTENLTQKKEVDNNYPNFFI